MDLTFAGSTSQSAAERPAPDRQSGAAEDYRKLEVEYANQGNWEALASMLIERSELSLESAERARCLMRAAQVFETNLADADRAFIVMLAAFQEYPSNEELATDLARMATVHARWPDLLSECDRLLPETDPAAKRADMLVAIAGWHKRDLGDAKEAEKVLEEAMAANPANLGALRSLVALHGQRGEWMRAATYLACAAGNATSPSVAIELALEAAVIYRDQVHDLDAAAEQYARVLELSPGHPEATAAFAEAAFRREDWSTALPLLETMGGLANQAQETTASLWHKIAWSAQKLGDMERARIGFRRAFAALPTYVPALQNWLQLAEAQGWWQDVCTVVPRLLAQTGTRLPVTEWAGHLMRLGRAHMALRDAKAASEAFMKAIELIPDLPGGREALAEANAKITGSGSANAIALIEQSRLLLKGAASTDERFEIICRIGRLQREELGDQVSAMGTFLQAAELRPEDPGVLHELLELYTQCGYWSRAVDVLERLAQGPPGKEKARYLVAAGNILNYELESPIEAVETYNRALDEDPEDRRSFERIERILTGRQAWQDLARAYRRMIKRIGTTPLSLDRRPWLLALWRGLAEVCRKRLFDIASAVAAYEVCVSLSPDDARQREALAETYEAQGKEGFAKAVKTREFLLARSNNPDGAARQIRALARLHGVRGQYDRTFCACAGLTALMKATPQEHAFYERNTLLGLPLATAGMTENLWQGYVCAVREDRRISQIFAAVSYGVIVARAEDPSVLGLHASQRVDLAQDRSSVSRVLKYASYLLGIPVPTIYVPPGASGEVELVVVREGPQAVPSFVLGRDLVAERTGRELAFLLAKKLAGLRGGRILLWPRLVPTMSELRVILVAAIRLVHPGFELPNTDIDGARKYAAFLRKVLPQAQLAYVAAVAEPLLADPGSINLVAWSAAAEEGANRAGLLGCGDMVAAARELVREARGRRSRPEEAILSLACWGVSSDYLDLRTHIGLAFSADDDAVTPPAFSMNPLRKD